MGLLTDKTAVITGASSGIGAAIAQCYAKEGANLILTARSEERLAKVASECSNIDGAGWVRTERCDLSDLSSIQNLASTIINTHGGLDVLVCNAGISEGGANVLEGSPDGWSKTIDVNTRAPMHLTRLLAPNIVERGVGGAVIFTGSLAGYRPVLNGAYCASKYALRGWALACYEALQKHGVKVAIIEPGYVDTPMVTSVKADHSLFIQPHDIADSAMLPFMTKGAAPLEIVLRLVRPVE